MSFFQQRKKTPGIVHNKTALVSCTRKTKEGVVGGGIVEPSKTSRFFLFPEQKRELSNIAFLPPPTPSRFLDFVACCVEFLGIQPFFTLTV